MSETVRRFFSGVTMDQAVMKAASHYGIDPAEIAYRPVEKRHGFTRVRRGVVIEVDPMSPRKIEGGSAHPRPGSAVTGAAATPRGVEADPLVQRERSQRGEEPREVPAMASGREPAAVTPPEGDDRPLRDRLARATGSLALTAERAVALALSLAGLHPNIAVLQGDGRLEIDLWGDGEERLLTDDGELILNLEHLVPRVMRGLVNESVACRVDCRNFHARRQARLGRIALDAAAEALRTGDEVALEPMAPDARRIVHLSLEENRSVSTRSVGRGLFKRVVIRPVGDGRQG